MTVTSTLTNTPTEYTDTRKNGIFTKFMPMYIRKDGSEEWRWYAETSAFPDWGVWGEGDTEEEAVGDMFAVIRDLIEWDWPSERRTP